jgi:putative transcriptional regulator
MNVTKLIKSVEEVAAYKRGEPKLKVTEIHPLRVDIKKLRAAIGMSQQEFARCYALSVGVVRNWEQGIREPAVPRATIWR